MRPFVLALLFVTACQTPDDGPGMATPDAGTMMADAAAQLPDATSCTPRTCAGQGAQCGSISNGCGGTLSCGTCDWDESCTNNACVCEPYCGSHECGSDGCGGSCGTCGTNETCSTSGQCN